MSNVSPLMKFLLASLLTLMSATAVADQFYVTVSINCDQGNSKISVLFEGAWNEAGENLVSNLDKNSVDPRKLVTFTQDRDGQYKIDTKPESRVCRLGRSNYSVTIAPMFAPHFHPEGSCATRIGAKATVSHGKTITATLEIDGCTEVGALATAVLVRPQHRPRYQYTKAEKFYENQ